MKMRLCEVTRCLYGSILLVMSLGCAPDSTPATRPNIVFILADDLGWADVGYQGSTFHRTPNIDALAQGGLSFSNAYAPACVCSPARAGFLTGQSPARLQLTKVVLGSPHGNPVGPVLQGPADDKLWEPVSNEDLPPGAPTLASVLGHAGYRTAMIGKWHFGSHPRDAGFDVVLGSVRRGELISYFSPYQLGSLSDGPKGEYITDRLTDEAIRFMEESANEPFFLFLSHFAPHSPFQAKQQLIDDYASRVDMDAAQHNPLYAAMIHSLDLSVGRVVGALKRLNLSANTLVIFTSDHGGLEQIRSRKRGEEPYHVTSNLPLRSGKGRLYEGGLRVPMVVSGAGVTRIGETSNVALIGMDFLPTLAALGNPAAKIQAELCDGVDFSPLFSRDKSIGERDLFFHFPHQSFVSSMRRGNMKLIHFYLQDRDELFDLAADPGEQTDLSMEHPELVAELRKALFTWLKESGAALPTLNPSYRD